MKKTLFSFLFLLLIKHLSAQDAEVMMSHHLRPMGYYTSSLCKSYQTNRVQTALTYKTVKGEKILLSQASIDERGRRNSVKSFSKKGEFINENFYSFKGDSIISELIQKNKKGEITTEAKISFNTENQPVWYMRRSTLKKFSNYSRMYIYNEMGKLIEIPSTGRKKYNNNTVKFEYDGGGRISETKTFDTKGKLLSFYHYDCPDEMEKATFKKLENKICFTEEMDSAGNKIQMTRGFSEKGRQYKQILKYNPQGLIIEFAYEYDKEKWNTKTIYENNESGQCTSIKQFTKGKLTSTEEILYYPNRLKKSSAIKKGKKVVQTLNEYEYH